MAIPEQDQHQDWDWDLSNPPRVVPALLLPATLLAQDALPRLLTQAELQALQQPMEWLRVLDISA